MNEPTESRGSVNRLTATAETVAAGHSSRTGPEATSLTGATRVNSKTFQELLDRNPVAVVDFYADWCGPCKVVSPIIEKLATEYDGKAKFAKLDVDDNPSTAEKFGVMSIPTLIIFKNGIQVDRIVGAIAAEAYRHRIEAVF